MKKFFVTALLLAVTTAFVGCGEKKPDAKTKETEKKTTTVKEPDGDVKKTTETETKTTTEDKKTGDEAAK
jgi:hypothetical protein